MLNCWDFHLLAVCGLRTSRQGILASISTLEAGRRLVTPVLEKSNASEQAIVAAFSSASDLLCLA